MSTADAARATAKVGLFLGKVEGYGVDANAVADDHRTKFLNLGFDFNLVNALAPSPPSAEG